ncbi:MAG: hypothetical protein J6R82_03225 [Clostridia bacterium]|nr:hypothetical protein [Clostridia bacterium]
MKRWITLLLCATLVLFYTSCGNKQEPLAPSYDEIVAAYEAEGYEVWCKEITDGSYGIVYQIQASDSDGDYINFYFFDTVEDAKEYEETVQFNGLVWIFTVIYGDPTWGTVQRYGTVVIEYEYQNRYLYKPFQELTA